jgi:CubicO group peptidase (beta-lactamase class C family)
VLAVAGVRKWESPDLAKVDDVVHLGSCTKAMTAAMIGQLCTEGKLRLDMPLREVFAGVSCVENSTWGDVTLTQLMQHRSGAPANIAFHQFDREHPGRPASARRSLLEQLCSMKRSNPTDFKYSNVGYIVLGHVAETIEGKPWEELIRDRVFARLGMQSAGFGPVGRPDGAVEIIPDRAWGHTASSGLVDFANSLIRGKAESSLVPSQEDNSPCLGPAGRVHMNLRDWSRFVILYGSEEGYRQLGISKEIWQSMLTPTESSVKDACYHSGWIVFDNPVFGGKGYFHNGSNTTWYCYAVAVPGKQQCLLVATNSYTTQAQKACDEIARYLASFPID